MMINYTYTVIKPLHELLMSNYKKNTIPKFEEVDIIERISWL